MVEELLAGSFHENIVRRVLRTMFGCQFLISARMLKMALFSLISFRLYFLRPCIRVDECRNLLSLPLSVGSNYPMYTSFVIYVRLSPCWITPYFVLAYEETTYREDIHGARRHTERDTLGDILRETNMEGATLGEGLERGDAEEDMARQPQCNTHAETPG